MKKIISITPTLTAILLAGVLIGGASLFSNRSVSELQTENEDAVIPVANLQPSFDTETTEDLKAEIDTLKTNLENLYKDHNNLVNDHNALLKYVNATAVSSDKTISVETDNSNLGTRVTSLEKKVDSLEETISDVCRWVFSGFSISCPSVRFGSEKLEDRIKKLEGEY